MRESKNLSRLHPSQWNKFRLKEVLRKTKGQRVLVIGDVGVDRYIEGSVDRISPEAPVPIVAVQTERIKLGLAANVVDNIHVLGGSPFLISVVGKDRQAQDFKSLLRKAGVRNSTLIVDRARRTIVKERVVSERQQLLRVDYETTMVLDSQIEALILRRVGELISEVDAVILQDYSKGLLTPKVMHGAFQIARRARKLIAVDPNRKSAIELYRGCHILTPNTREAESLAGMKIADETSLVEAGFRILRKTSLRHLVITRGKEGMAIFSTGTRKVQLIPTYAREVYDVSGAGDTVISVLTLVLAAGGTVEEAAILGNLAAGVVVGKRGTATVSQDEVIRAMEFFTGDFRAP